jgi:DNA helicase-2/ATP-dependent DNA helicase PcrA
MTQSTVPAMPAEEEAPLGGRFKWSSSRLKRLLQCPRQFKYVYIEGLPTVLTAPLLFGKTVHEVICGAHDDQMESDKLPPLSDLLPQFDTLWNKGLEEHKPLFRPSHPTPERYVTIGHEMLRIFHAGNRDAQPPLAVEIPFEMEMEIGKAGTGTEDSKRKVTLRGVIDRLDEVSLESGEGALVVVDYKSGQKKPSSAEVEEETQLTVYALAAQQLWQMPVARLEIYFLRDGLALPTQRSPASLR